jgi:hypothetical protein
MHEVGRARGSGVTAAPAASPDAASIRLRGIELPQDPTARDEFFARLLPDFDAAWGATSTLHRGESGRIWLLGLRKHAERAADRCLYLRRDPHRCRFCAVALHVEADAAVPESQVDCALAWAAEVARGGMASIAAEGLTCAPTFFRYQDLMAAPLSAVHACLLAAAADGNSSAALRGMPFVARPAAARCSPIYLRFLVGVAVSEDGGRGALEDSGWSALADIVRAVLGVRLRVPVNVDVALGNDLYGAAHEGLRRYQAARLGRFATGTGGRGDVSAVLDLHRAVPPWRVRLALLRDRQSIAACMLQIPWDESPAQMAARISRWLGGRGITQVATLTSQGGRAFGGSILAEPV